MEPQRDKAWSLGWTLEGWGFGARLGLRGAGFRVRWAFEGVACVLGGASKGSDVLRVWPWVWLQVLGEAWKGGASASKLSPWSALEGLRQKL